jgi:hypothetical protein
VFKAKKTAIHRRAKQILSACANETRRQNLARQKRKVIRAHYENGLLVVQEDFVRLPNLYASSLQFQIVNNLFSVLRNQLRAKGIIEF